ncbi:MAG: adenylate/guanylate cyclase domain-containing protein [Myxococcota bacterium]
MSDEERDVRRRLETLEAQQRMNEAADETLELALRDRLPLTATMRSMLPLLVAHTGAEDAWVRTYDEDLRLRDFRFAGAQGAFPLEAEAILGATEGGDRLQRATEGHVVLAQPLDVAGELFGAAALALPGQPEPERVACVATLLDTWCEELDNYLASIAWSRRKHRVTQALSDALKEPVLDAGVNQAIEVLRGSVAFDDLLLVFKHEEDFGGASLNYKIIEGGELTHDSRAPDGDVDEFIKETAPALLRGESRALLERFGFSKGREEVLIAGVRRKQVLGRVVVTSSRGEFNTYDRDLVELFADYLRQRVVDFNREWKRLALTFPPAVVRRLLQEEDYRERYLDPVEKDVAVLFCDISGFTRISEQVLGEPALIGKLIDAWGRKVVEIVWETGGVFDKMVGDCVIGLWGPPFHGRSPAEACAAAAEAALRIRAYTNGLGDGALFPQLKGLEPPIGVATGLNYCPLFVGLFGPNEDYTGFSSGMNNTARLQGVAERDEILCMERFAETLGTPERFGEARSAPVKNVAEPLRFRTLER